MKRKHLLWVIVLSLLLSGCAGIRFPKLPTPKKPETAYNWNERSKITPRAVVAGNRVVVLEESEKTLQVGLEQTPQKLSFAQRLGGWISGLGILGIILLIAGFILAPAATAGFLVKLLFKWKKAFRETVLAVRESKAIEKDADLRNSLASKQSLSTKKMVDGIKREI